MLRFIYDPKYMAHLESSFLHNSTFAWSDIESILTNPEWRAAFVLQMGKSFKMLMVKRGLCLPELIDDEDDDVRLEAARTGYGLDTLINEDNILKVNGFDKQQHIDKWRRIEDAAIIGDSRAWKKVKELIDSGYKEAILMTAGVRFKKKMIKRKLCLEELVHDHDWRVRQDIAKAGYFIDQLIKDDDQRVANIAIRIKVENIEKGALKEGNWKDVKDFIKEGYVEELLNHTHLPFKRQMIKRKMCLNEIANHHDFSARAALAQAGYKLSKLVDDEDDDVRIAVARKGYGHKKLVNDKSWRVRKTIAIVGDHNCLKVLINDPDWQVRRAVVNRGYGIEKLIWDKNEEVRKAARMRYRNRQCATSYSYIHHQYKYHDPIEANQDYISCYNYYGYSEEYYEYN